VCMCVCVVCTHTHRHTHTHTHTQCLAVHVHPTHLHVCIVTEVCNYSESVFLPPPFPPPYPLSPSTPSPPSALSLSVDAGARMLYNDFLKNPDLPVFKKHEADLSQFKVRGLGFGFSRV
jgi:hypothetical protein